MTKLHNEETFLIRPMRAEDLEQVQAIDRISFSLSWPTSAYDYELKENPLSSLWVAEVSSSTVQNTGDREQELVSQPRVVGMVVLWMILDEAHIATIAVHPDFRGRGIAQHLLVTALIEAIQKGAQSATLEVRANNMIAQQLYRRFGFVVVGNRPRYYRDNNEDALIMTLNGLNPEYLKWLKGDEWK